VFSPSGTPPTNEASIGAAAHDDTAWPEPIKTLDNRDLDPPEPMVKILATAETMQPGEVLAALLRREPLFLFPELAKRGHSWRGAFEADGKTYRVLVRIGAPKGSAA
jgi:TusA-related sulfurtransferase